MEADRGATGEKVTVIIPAFNAEATIRETLDSVSAQSHGALEIFAVDDGSSDGTADAIADLARLDGRITLVRQVNAGVAAARNAGLALASGRYAAWLDADDLWHPDKIAAQLDVFRAAPEPLGLVYTGYRLVDASGVIVPNFRTLADVSGHTLCRQIGTTYFTNVSSIMAPVDLARRCGGHDPRLRAEGIEGAEDLLLQLRISARAPLGMRPEAFVAYRIHGANMSRAIGRAARSNLRALEWIAREVPEVPDFVFRLGRGRMSGFALQMIRAGDVSGGLRLLFQLFRGQPRETAVTLGLILKWLADDSAGRHVRDTAVGKAFVEADPGTVPWHGHMLIRGSDLGRLIDADRERLGGSSMGAQPDHATARNTA
jgi:glycosyltransferase involved in cell wall biosynthesis